MTMPPMLVPCPPKYLVRLFTTTLAPCSSGRQTAGEAAVLSMIRGILYFLQTADISSNGNIFSLGLPIVSP